MGFELINTYKYRKEITHNEFTQSLREAAKKVIFLMAVLLRGGGVDKALTIKKKIPFFLRHF